MKTQHYLQSLCMALAMIVMIPAQLCALTGQGNSTSPYQIGSASDLREFRDIVNGSNGQTRNISAWAVLTNDIEDLGAWTPIGNSSGHYKGTFDGQGHSITGMTLLNYTKVNQGLFGYIENATVRNFTLSGEMSSSTQINSGDDDCSGTVVGYAKGSSHIENVTSHVNWTLTALQKHLGGIVGQIQDKTQVRGCTYTGTLDAGASRDGLGGIVGYAYTSNATSIAYCLFSGTIRTTSTNNDLTYVGGILGYINDETSKGTFGGVSYCFAGGTLETSVSKCRAAIIACPKGKALHNGNVDQNYYLASTADQALGNDKTPETSTVNQGITVALTANNPDFGTATQRYVSPTWNAAQSSGTATQLEVSAVPASHYHYVGWSDQGEQTHTRALTQDVTAQANFAIDRHTITIRRNYDYRSTVSCELNGAAVELQTEEDGNTIYKATFDYGAKPVFICTPADYCVFDKWSTGSTKNRLTYEVQGDATLTANCSKLTYEVNLEVQGEGSVSGSSPSNVKQWTSATEGYGDAFNNVTLVATPAAHYHLDSWSDNHHNTYSPGHSGDDYTCTTDDNGVNTLVLKIKANTTFYAYFAIDQHVITLGEVANGTIAQSGSGTYDYNTPITLTATPAEHYHFVSWSDGTNTYDGTPQEDGSNTLAVTVTGDATYTATFAIDQPYLVPTYNTASDPTSGIASWATGYVADFTTVTDATEAVTWPAGWYVVDSEVTITDRITCSGAVHLILAQGGRLEAKAGITVSGADNFLTIYGQPDGSGELIATGGQHAAGIGGGDWCSGDNITINGGTVDAQGGYEAAGIGGGYHRPGNNITINGGTVDAQGGDGAAGIGGGCNNGAGKNITINGGTVDAQGGDGAAGIGGGYGGSGNNITISGGTVDAQGGSNGAGIGGGNNGSGENITINGGTVDAQGGGDAAGIGGGYYGSGNNIKVSTKLTIYNTGSDNAVITNSGSDLASALSGIQSVLVCVPHTHQYDGQAVADKYISVAATCTSLATYYYSCSICGLCEKDSNRTFEAGVMLPHNFTAEVASESYLASAATCTAHDTYYYSCAVCGENEKDDEHTFEGTTYGHLFDNDGKCTKCDAQGIPFLEPTYNTANDPTSGIASWATGYVAEYTTVTDATEAVTWPAGWYVVNREVTITGRITCSGAVHLILAQGGRLEAKAGITVSGADNSLTIYGQPDGSGELIATGGYHAAGIGGGNRGSGNNITINGGTVDAQGGYNGAGIGGGYWGSGNNITINGGTVDAQGGDSAAGIGGGFDGSGNNITINGGTVDAQGGSNGAGIGGGGYDSGNNITINGGTVDAQGGYDAAGIGGGYYGSGENIKVSTKLTIYNTGSDNAVITNSGSDLASSLSGIQSVFVCVPHTHQYDGQAVADKYISVAATCTSLATYYYSCSICGLCEKDSNRTFEAGVMLPHNFTAEVASESYLAIQGDCTTYPTYYYCCAVCGENEKDDEHTFEGTTYAHLFDDDGKCTECDAQGIPFLEPTYNTANDPTSGIASWATGYVAEYTTVKDATEAVTWPSGWYVVNRKVTITSRITCRGAVHLILAQGGRFEAKAGITVSGADNSLTIYGQPDGSGELIATSGAYTAGIGGGKWGSGNNITINGGTVEAQGVDGGAGIGGGGEGSGDNITINGGTVDAQGGYGAAGIGGGYGGSGNNITISGGTVDAQGGSNGAGIGGGYYGSGENIKVSTTLTIYNTGSNNAVITNSGGDLASALRVQYAFVCLAGDINADGHLSIADLTLLIDLLSRDAISITPAADVNGADGVTRDDIEALRDKLLR